MISFFITLPYIFLFYSLWILASLWRPFCTLSLVAVLSNPAAAIRKGQLFVWTLQYLLLCNDKKWKKDKNKEPNGKVVGSKTIIFVRHGESLWNETFNKGDRSVRDFVLGFIPNLIKAIAYEWYLWVSGASGESWFYDSPLSAKGVDQAYSIQRDFCQNAYLTPKEEAMKQICLQKKNSIVVSSNLRRAIATIAIGLQDRWAEEKGKDDPIQILTCLQEISRNPDALSITPAHGIVAAAETDPAFMKEFCEKHCETKHHYGNKPVNGNGLSRLQEFCQLVFELDVDNVVAGGHSLWFRSFFQTYLFSDHVAQKKKIVNGGLVSFTLEKVETETKEIAYRVDSSSVTVLHRGFG
ncbi:hypothetical protein FisN_23Lh189 [Fistulifera solaris]|uniref:Uncharacterized protein n=1 Tax=Fistulifera solaris TaxID=1519565 RepID=A0A1Z5K563_FISSO|nr:hypothetical protein FisN_23Lh189 [Fistulifera solaris]|eukprot:GAX21241.1 hypothetical protein FisN_23Lh189 [Fistulifera solaris]